jgi:hypothetical protein
MASLYCRGNMWWAKSYEGGKAVRWSLGTKDKVEAKRRLKLHSQPRQAPPTSKPIT